MPVQHAIWTVGQSPAPLPLGRLVSEQVLEKMILADPKILSNEWLLIGNQETTNHGGRIDLLALAPDSSLVLIELKRDKTPREIVAQALDYASWVEQLTPARIAQIYQRFSNGGVLDNAFIARFGFPLDESTLNQSHQIVVVASELDAASERIVKYLNARNIPINVMFFQVFEYLGGQLLSRAWLIDPVETQANVATAARSIDNDEPWNGEFYVSFGDSESRSWEDARKYGFVSAGGGRWYSRTLDLLEPGNRVWVRIPQVGYVGVGIVTESVVPAKDFKIETPSGERVGLEVLQHGRNYIEGMNDVENSEYFVRVKWLDTVSEDDAIYETGLFGNQNTVCQPVTPRWRHTVERLKTFFPNWNSAA